MCATSIWRCVCNIIILYCSLFVCIWYNILPELHFARILVPFFSFFSLNLFLCEWVSLYSISNKKHFALMYTKWWYTLSHTKLQSKFISFVPHQIEFWLWKRCRRNFIGTKKWIIAVFHIWNVVKKSGIDSERTYGMTIWGLKSLSFSLSISLCQCVYWRRQSLLHSVCVSACSIWKHGTENERNAFRL